jgi:hypothetical protein
MYKKLADKSGAILDNCILRTQDCATIPFDLDNTDYQAYLAWLAEGNTPLPPDEPAA